jgi:UDP-N-acetylglucosamine 2-epimerase (non-hydrolysing)
MNRRLTGALATLHVPPTEQARDNLLREGVSPDAALVTGNTVIDALFWMLENSEPSPELKRFLDDPRRLVVVTAHRRESWGVPMGAIGDALADLARAERGTLFVFPIHPNPIVRHAIGARAGRLANVKIIEPLPYAAFVHLMAGSTLLLTDSGGIQEEAAALRKPVLVMRDVTERAEGVETGTAEVVGRDTDSIVRAVRRLLNDDAAYRARTEVPNPYGDGHAAERIAERVLAFLGR